MIGGMMKTRDDRGGRVGAARRLGGDQAREAAQQPGHQDGLEHERAGPAGSSLDSPVTGSGGDEDTPDEEDEVRRDLDQEAAAAIRPPTLASA